MDQDVLTRKQAMDALNVKDYRTLNKLIKAGLFPSFMRGATYASLRATLASSWRSTKREEAKYLANNAGPGPGAGNQEIPV